MPVPNPSNALLALVWEDAPSVPRRTPRADREFGGETLSNNALTVARTNITRNAMTVRPMPGKLEAGGELRFDAFNPAADWWLAAAYFGHASTDGPETDVFEHRMSRAETAIDFPETFCAMVWRDDMAQRFLGCRVSQLQLTIQERALVAFVATVVPERGDYWPNAARTAGAGTAFPTLRGMLPEQFGTDATQNVGVDVIAQDATTVTIKSKLGDAATYDGADLVVTRGVWTRISDENDVPLGDLGMPLQIYFPVGGVFANDDAFSFARRISEWTPSFPVSIAVNEVYAVLNVDGLEEEVEQLTLTVAMPTEARFGVGGRAARRTRQRGQQTVTGQISREVLSTDMRERLELGLPFHLEVHLRTGVFLSDTRDHSLRIVAASCVPSGNTPTVEDASTYNEQINFTAHPSDDATDPEDVVFYVTNDVEDLETA